LGCDKNTADSSGMAGLLVRAGHRIAEDGPADVVIVNTCGFILPAKEESIGAVLSAVAGKTENPDLKVLAVGCLVQKYLEELEREIPEVDGFFGVNDPEGILAALEEMEKGMKPVHRGPEQLAGQRALPRVEETVTAYLKIADGCDTRCTYCAIPSIKGPYVSRPPDVLMEEARSLAAAGVRELILVAQDTTAYGCDLGPEVTLTALLRQLLEVEGFHWIRILYAYPDGITRDLLELMRDNPRIAAYLDIPFQHADDGILRTMGRRHTGQDLRNLLKMVREVLPEVVVRSTFITGFPGETDRQFQVLLDFLEEVRLDWVGAFVYSREDGTPAAGLPGQVPERVKVNRYNRLMKLQQDITREKLGRFRGSTLEVVLEEQQEDGLWLGRSAFMAPEVDGLVEVRTGESHRPGDFVPVRITGSGEYDLTGEEIHDHIQ